MSAETYPCYIKIHDERDEDEPIVELPSEADGTLWLSTVQAQTHDAIGLRFKTDSGSWRGVRHADGILNPPLEGWGDREYCIVVPRVAVKRKIDGDIDDSDSKASKVISHGDRSPDLIVRGLPFAATEEDMKNYFQQFGKLDMYEMKFESGSRRSRGFGFIRFKNQDAVIDEVLSAHHTMMGRKIEVCYPKKKHLVYAVPTRIFIGNLPKGTSKEELRQYFSECGDISDVHIPPNMPLCGFVTFLSQTDASNALNKTCFMKGNRLRVALADGKKDGTGSQQQQQQQQMLGMQQQPNQFGYGNMQGNIQGPNSGYGNMSNNYQGMQANMMQGNMMQNNMQQNNMQGNKQGKSQEAMLNRLINILQQEKQGKTQGNTPGSTPKQGSTSATTQATTPGNTQNNTKTSQQSILPTPAQGYGYNYSQASMSGGAGGGYYTPQYMQSKSMQGGMQGGMQGMYGMYGMQGMQGMSGGNVMDKWMKS